MPPGGHIENNETHEQAAIREIKEELGFIHGKFIIPCQVQPKRIDKRARIMLQPHLILKEEIAPDHFHLDLIFYAICNEQTINSPEGHMTKWMTLEEIHQTEKMIPNVRLLAIRGFTLQGLETVDFSFFESSSSI